MIVDGATVREWHPFCTPRDLESNAINQIASSYICMYLLLF